MIFTRPVAVNSPLIFLNRRSSKSLAVRLSSYFFRVFVSASSFAPARRHTVPSAKYLRAKKQKDSLTLIRAGCLLQLFCIAAEGLPHEQAAAGFARNHRHASGRNALRRQPKAAAGFAPLPVTFPSETPRSPSSLHKYQICL